MIDWQKVAEQYGMTPAEFETEVLTVAACIGAMAIDEKGGALKFTCSDEIGRIEVLISRV